MTIRVCAMAFSAALLLSTTAMAQDIIQVPTGGTGGPAVPQNPPADPDDTPEEIAKDAARDLKDSRFYNKPGATRADYDAAWQECRLIARGSRTPSGTIPYYYNPSVISPLAAGIGAGIGGLIGSAIAEGELRRANRRACLLIRGWRLVKVPDAQAAKVTAMTDAQRSTYFDGIVGAATVEGEVTEMLNFEQPAHLAERLAKPVTGAASIFMGKKVDAATPVTLAENEGVVVFALRRPDADSLGRSAQVNLLRYDRMVQDVVYQPRDWKKTGDKTSYSRNLRSGDKMAPLEVQVVTLTAGDYVIDSMAAGTGAIIHSNCFGAPGFRVEAGKTVYIGDFVPFINARNPGEVRYDGMAHTAHIDDARAALATKQPALAAAMRPAEMFNQATYACAGPGMRRYDLPGLLSLAALTAKAAPPEPVIATETPAVASEEPAPAAEPVTAPAVASEG